MSRRRGPNLSASIRQRLLDKARERDRPFSELLQYFAMERFLYRLSKSPHAGKFVLKGALMFAAWRAPTTRPTMDIDLLGITGNSIDAIVAVTKELCIQEVEPDGLAFDPESVVGERIVEDADYEGVRLRFRGTLGTARISMQIDIGFGDVVVPRPVMTEYPSILSLPAPRLQGYSRESAVAEKFEIMVKLGLINSRIKDFYDIWLLSRQFDFDGVTLATAISKTFVTRGTRIPAESVTLTEEFAADAGKQAQWNGFLRRNYLRNTPDSFSDVVIALADFLGPVTRSLAAGKSFEQIWQASGSWRDRGE